MGEINEILQSLTQELRRGTIVLSVLSQLDRPQYGYTLVKSLEDKGVRVDTNTLYPLLRRLEKQEILVSITSVQPSGMQCIIVWQNSGKKCPTVCRSYWRRKNESEQTK